MKFYLGKNYDMEWWFSKCPLQDPRVFLKIPQRQKGESKCMELLISDLARAFYFALIWPVWLPDRVSTEWGVLDNTPSMSFGLKIAHCLPSVHLGSTRGGKRQKSPGLMKSRRSENDCGRLATQSSCKADGCGWKGQVQRVKTLDWEQGELGSWPYYVTSRQCALELIG